MPETRRPLEPHWSPPPGRTGAALGAHAGREWESWPAREETPLRPEALSRGLEDSPPAQPQSRSRGPRRDHTQEDALPRPEDARVHVPPGMAGSGLQGEGHQPAGARGQASWHHSPRLQEGQGSMPGVRETQDTSRGPNQHG